MKSGGAYSEHPGLSRNGFLAGLDLAAQIRTADGLIIHHCLGREHGRRQPRYLIDQQLHMTALRLTLDRVQFPVRVAVRDKKALSYFVI